MKSYVQVTRRTVRFFFRKFFYTLHNQGKSPTTVFHAQARSAIVAAQRATE